MFSVIIPAHNEANVIERCLTFLTENLGENCAEIIVVCNGCTDDTEQRAARFAGVHVINTSVASKVAALNLGDEVAQYFPIVYMDADITISIKDLMGTIEKMNENTEIMVAAPQLTVDLSRSDMFVKSFYNIWMRLPYFTTGQMVGSGIFILSELGRKRFTVFPNVISDDGYVRSLYQAGERRMIKDYYFTIFAPKTMTDLIKIKTRVRFGNMEVSEKYSNVSIGKDNTSLDIVRLVLRRPWLILQSFIYIYVQIKTRKLSRTRMAIADFTTWERDESSRDNH